jgi:hypothetical protein
MAEHSLSKSTFIRGVQCFKSLYLYKNRYFLRDPLSQEQQAKFARGKNVGLLAQQIFPGGVDVSPASPRQYAKSLALTAEWVQKGREVIYEAAFKHANTLIFLDILVRNGDAWDAYEVKSSVAISETYIQDAALQFNVLTGSGLQINRMYLIHVNPDYVHESEFQPQAYFRFTEVTEQVKELQPWVEETRIKAFAAMNAASSPAIDIGKHCRQPYPCDFIGHCHKHLPAKSVFKLSLFSSDQLWEWYYQGKRGLSDILADAHFSASQQRQWESISQNRIVFDADALSIRKPAFANCVPVFVFWLRPAIPLLRGFRPYQFLPLMAVSGKAENMIIQWFTAENANEELKIWMEELLKTGGIVVYNDAEIKRIIPEALDVDEILSEGIWCHPALSPPQGIEELGGALGLPFGKKGGERLRSDFISQTESGGSDFVLSSEIETYSLHAARVLNHLLNSIFP